MPKQPEDRSAVRLYRRGKVWWTWYYDAAGRQVRVTTKRTSRRAAETEARRIEETASGCAPAAPPEPYIVTEALQELIDASPWRSAGTLTSHASRACQIARHIGEEDLAALSRPTIEGFISDRRKEVSDHSVFKELVLLRLALKKARDDGRWAGDVAAMFPRHRANYRPRERWLERREAERLLGSLGPERRLWLLVALYTGARKGEVEGLDWSDFDWKRQTIHIRGTKTEGADRTIPLVPPLRKALWRQREDAGKVVPCWGNVIRDLNAAAERTGIKPCSPNDLRRTLATWLAEDGVPERHIADWLGHGSHEMVRRVYARVSPKALRAAAASVPALKARPARCDTGVIAVRGQTGPKPQKPQHRTALQQRARLESNQRPLASEAKGNLRLLPLRKSGSGG